jgi:hypothetical protein
MMPNETSEPEPPQKKKREIEIRDLTPKNDVKGGAAKAEKQAFPRTGEIDFMRGGKA